MKPRGFNRSTGGTLHSLGYQPRDDEDQGRNNHVWDVEEHLLKKGRYVAEIQDIDRGKKEYDDKEPLYEAPDERARVKTYTSAIKRPMYIEAFQRGVHTERLNDLVHCLSYKDGNEPADEKDDNGRNEARNVGRHHEQCLLEGGNHHFA
jgi:hypothetical protein